MDSGMISKIQKAKRYAEEPERIQIDRLEMTFKGDHDTYHVTFADGAWTCQCLFYHQRGVCSHTMAIERLLQPMLQQPHVEAAKQG